MSIKIFEIKYFKDTFFDLLLKLEVLNIVLVNHSQFYQQSSFFPPQHPVMYVRYNKTEGHSLLD